MGRGEEESMYVYGYVCMYVYIAKAARDLYCQEYFRLITVCYVSPAQFLAHIRNQTRAVVVCFSPAFLGQHHYHSDSMTAVGFGADWASI